MIGIATEIVRREFVNADLGGELLDDVPDELFRNSFSPRSTGATHMPEKLTRVNSGRLCPFVQQTMHPMRDGNGSNVTSLSAQVNYLPNALRAAEGGPQSARRVRGDGAHKQEALRVRPDPVYP